MKFPTQARGLILTAAVASAFPHKAIEELQRRGVDMDSYGMRSLQARASLPASGVPYPPDPAQVEGNFDAKAQYVSNTGVHQFVAPGPNDARGPCPGLNAMANHGYIPHNGVATISQFISGTFDVFGMKNDLAGFLAIYGAVFDGDLTKWSIGGPYPTVGLGATGLIGSHNKYEGDASPTRPDLYQFGNNYKINWDQWKALYNKQAGIPDDQANFNLAVLQQFRSERFDESVSQNPYFFNGAFTGVLVQPAAYTFIYRFMGNKSAEHPDGVLNRESLKAFFGVTENADGTFSGGVGQERIPDNWYKRAIGSEYGLGFFIEDVLYEASLYPKFLSVGGNTGKVNTFTPVNVANLTGGVFNAATLLQGNNLFCFAYQAGIQALPDLVTGVLGTLTGLLSKLAPEAAQTISSFGCPQLAKISAEQLAQFPGYKGP